MISRFSLVWLFVTLWTVARQAPLSMGFSRQEYWSGLPCCPPGDLPNPGIKPRSPAFQVDSLPSEPPGSFTISFIILVYYDISLTINFNVAYLILKFRWVCLLAYIYILTCIICSDLRPDFTIKGEQKDILILTLPNQKLCFKTSLCKFIKLLKPREALYGFIEHQHKLNSNELIFIEWSLLWLQLLRTCTAGYWLQHRTVIC